MPRCSFGSASPSLRAKTAGLSASVISKRDTASGDARATLERVLGEAVTAATTAWPTVRADIAAWIRVLGELSPKPFDPTRPFGEMLVSDHYLAFACAAGDTAAVAECDAILRREAGFAADGTKMHASARDEATQSIRARSRIVASSAGVSSSDERSTPAASATASRTAVSQASMSSL